MGEAAPRGAACSAPVRADAGDHECDWGGHVTPPQLHRRNRRRGQSCHACMRATTRPVLPGFMPSSLPTVVSEMSEIEILKRQYDTRLNRNGKGTQRSAIAASDDQRHGLRRKSAVRRGLRRLCHCGKTRECARDRGSGRPISCRSHGTHVIATSPFGYGVEPRASFLSLQTIAPHLPVCCGVPRAAFHAAARNAIYFRRLETARICGRHRYITSDTTHPRRCGPDVWSVRAPMIETAEKN